MPTLAQAIPPRPDITRRIEVPSDAEQAELTRKLEIVAFVRILLVTISLGALLVFTELHLPRDIDALAEWQYVLIGTAYGLSIVYAIGLRYPRAVLALAYAQVAADTLIASVLVSKTNGVDSVFTFVYVFVVLGASVTLYRRGAVIAAIGYLLTFGTIVTLQVDRHQLFLPKVDFGRAMFSFFINSVGIALVAVLASTLAEKARITGRRLAEKQIDYEQLEELHAAILRSLPAGLMTIDPDGVVRFANEAALHILRTKTEDAIGHALFDVVPAMAQEWERRKPTTTLSASRERYEASFTRRDGKTIRIGFSFAPLGLESGFGAGSIAVFQDVTEIVRLKDAYERAERLATVGKVAAGLAHEVRNPLASMCASIEVLRQAINPPDPMKRLMTNIVKEADRLNALITDFLAFARPREPHLELTDLSAVVRGVVDVFENDAAFTGGKLQVELESGLDAQIDADQIRQVIWNLARNAAEAMKTVPGTLTIITRARNETVEIVIRDTGPGIAPEHIKRIFDPFYTTKEGGSGLGLAITHSIVQAHGGRILVESKPGEGTEITVALPTARSSVPIWTAESVDWGESSDLVVIGPGTRAP